MNTIDMNTIGTNSARDARRRAAIAIVVALVLGFAAIATETNVTGGGISALMGNYISEVGEALGAQ